MTSYRAGARTASVAPVKLPEGGQPCGHEPLSDRLRVSPSWRSRTPFSARAAASAVKWALVNMTETTWIAGRFVSGPVMFEHDDARMARGEPCTRVLRFLPGKGPAEELVAFH